jgi:predicted RNA-binding Zn ribbon-like protein
MTRYPGPVGEEPLAVEFHNTLYALRGRGIDGLADPAGAALWVAAMAGRLPEAAIGPAGDMGALDRLRVAVREALHARVERRPVDQAAVDVINAASAGAPSVVIAEGAPGDRVRAVSHFPGSPPDAVLRSAIATSAIELMSSEAGDRLRTCGAPGCVLMFSRDHPRREWCSASCGNRARQARHQARRRSDGATRGARAGA